MNSYTLNTNNEQEKRFGRVWKHARIILVEELGSVQTP
jgi:hypothetical protein